VDADAQGADNGTSWSDAFVSLQSALSAALPDSEIWVAAETYRPAGPGGDRNLSFNLKNRVALYGGFAGAGSVAYPGGETQRSQRDVAEHVTTLSGDLNADDGPDWANNAENSYHVVVADNADPTAIIDGFTIRGGNANYLPSGDPRGYGGGVHTTYPGSFTMTHCTIVGNFATVDGGGVFVSTKWYESTRISYCTIRDNIAGYAGGGGIAARAEKRANLIITCCTISGNTVTGPAGRGGGIYCLKGMSPPEPDSVIVANCTFINNRAADSGGALACNDDNDLALINCTLTNNYAPAGRSIACQPYSSYPGRSQVKVANCILWDGPNPLWANEESTITVSYSNVLRGLPGAGNIWLDPMFVNPSVGDYRLSACSPCIDAADSSAYPPEVAPEDRDGHPRFVDDGGVSDIGSGPAPVVDMGAFEFQDGTAPPAPPAPQNVVTGKADDCGAIRITWDASPGADGYVIHRSTLNDLMTASVVGSCAAGPYDDFSAAARVNYWYWVTAVRGGCSSRFGQSASGFRFTPGDLDHDCDVDQEDFGQLQACLTGVGTPQDDANCIDARIDEDTDVDENDVDMFLASFGGPGMPLPAGCPGQ
jgi:predicted outer membrane repeat protein